jgi:type II secretory pathway component PulK
MSGRRRERGMAMIWAMLLLVAFSAFSVSVLQRGQRIDLEAKRDLESKRAFHAAQGGLAWARIEISRNLSCREKNTSEIGGCRVEVTVEPTVGGWQVRSRAMPGNAVVSALLTHRSGSELPEMTDWQRIR